MATLLYIFVTNKILLEFFCWKNNSKLYFVYLPKYQRYKSGNNDKEYDLVKNIVNDLKIPFIDIHKEVFLKEQNPLKLFPFELPGHYNIDGYKKVAETPSCSNLNIIFIYLLSM